MCTLHSQMVKISLSKVNLKVNLVMPQDILSSVLFSWVNASLQTVEVWVQFEFSIRQSDYGFTAKLMPSAIPLGYKVVAAGGLYNCWNSSTFC